MSLEIEGKGYLFRSAELVSSVHSRLPFVRDGRGRSRANGGLWLPKPLPTCFTPEDGSVCPWL